MDIGIENIQEEPYSKDIIISQQMKNENPFDNMKLSKTEMLVDTQDCPKNENNNKNNIFDANPTILSINEFTKTQNIFPEEMTETQVVTSNIQKRSDNVVNSLENSTKNQNNFEANNDLGNAGLNKGSITNFTMNNSNQNIMQGSQQFPLIDSQQIYGNENNEQQNLVKSHKINESIPEQIVKYKIPKPDENILNYNPEHISPAEPESQDFVEKKKDVLITENEVKQVENQLKSLKVSKTKYLSEEEVNNLINNDEIAENNLNNNKEDTNQFTYVQNPIDENDNIYRTNFIDTNIPETNFARHGDAHLQDQGPQAPDLQPEVGGRGQRVHRRAPAPDTRGRAGPNGERARPHARPEPLRPLRRDGALRRVCHRRGVLRRVRGAHRPR